MRPGALLHILGLVQILFKCGTGTNGSVTGRRVARWDWSLRALSKTCWEGRKRVSKAAWTLWDTTRRKRETDWTGDEKVSRREQRRTFPYASHSASADPACQTMSKYTTRCFSDGPTALGQNQNLYLSNWKKKEKEKKLK